MKVIVVSNPYEIPDDWDLGKGTPSTSEQLAEIERVHAAMFSRFREQCADCGSTTHLAGSEECALRFDF